MEKTTVNSKSRGPPPASLGLLFLFVLLDILGFSIVLPLLPIQAESLGATPSVIGCLAASNAFAQLLAAPFIGRLSDVYGRKPLLLLCLLGTAVSFLMLALATNLPTLFASRLLDGFLGGNIALAQAYVTDITTPETRSKGMGVIGAAFGIGFVFGPALGGTVSKYSLALPAQLSCALSVCTFLAVFMRLPESLSDDAKARNRSKAAISSFKEGLSVLDSVASNPALLVLFLIKFVFHTVFTIFESSLSLYATHFFGVGHREACYVLTFVGFLFSAAQGGLIPRLSKRFSDRQLMLSSLMVLALACLVWFCSTAMHMFLASMFFFGLCTGVLNTVITSAISKEAAINKVGSTLGLTASVGSLTRVVAPVTSGMLMEAYGVTAPALASCLLAAGLWVFVSAAYRPKSHAL